MRGTIKWFSKEKGYGFISNSDYQDLYFHVTDVFGSDLPEQGDSVTYEVGVGKKGEKATEVCILSRAPQREQRPQLDKVVCPECSRNIIPRVITYRGTPEKLVCPLCGAITKDLNACFVTTACCERIGLPDDCFELRTLRSFRDGYMSETTERKKLVDLYYKLAPSLVILLRTGPVLDFAWQRIQLTVRLIQDGAFEDACRTYMETMECLHREVQVVETDSRPCTT